ncbi:excinuclease ABC subunit UvrC [Desulfonatronovibrio hydrogenovorans]|uniref:excinuclease ABC subunit UvrC n=1 Tax=Desulfonatronovibrio hydrogenovorans TaxID=53245 RepID=UPI000558EF6C|nr:excinuclease ABC subunit UvrC [Desulfonatronovibrio hydrogenovorans]
MITFTQSDFPQTPGVYMMKDDRNRIIYVGKARNIRKRLGSYFGQSKSQSPKTRVMLTRVQRIDTISTLTEKDALLLESSLIKKHRPRYNIVLRDDKQYVLFKLDKTQDYPALELTRKAARDKSLYFGPFTSGLAARQTLKVINRLFQLRKCGHKKFRNRVRPCLQYFIKRCMGPCCLEINPSDYHLQVSQVELFLSGRSAELTDSLSQEMSSAAESLDFERAALLRDQLRAIEQTTKAQSMVIPAGQDMDVFELDETDQGLCTGVIFVRQGKVLDNKNFFWPGHEAGDHTEKENALVSILSQFYGPDKFIPERIVLPVKIKDSSIAQVLSEYRGARVSITRARGETMNSLLTMARHNCLLFAAKASGPSRPRLGEALKLGAEPCRIECVDVSHQSGRDTRVGLVVFENGMPLKADYRIYNMSSSAQGDDYQALREFTVRRQASSLPGPDLLLIDGGLGQLNAVQKALTASDGSWNLAAIAKGPTRSKGQLNDQVYIPGRKNPLPLKPGSPELLFLQRIRDEAHRFVIGSLRKTRSRNIRKSDLERIPGIGPHKAKELWNYFRDLDLILKAGPADLEKVPGFGPKTAARTAQALKEWNTQNT